MKSADVTIEGLIVRDTGDGLASRTPASTSRPARDRAVVRRNDLVYNLFGLWIEKAERRAASWAT